MKIAIVDYGLGNLQSVMYALQHLGVETVVSSNSKLINLCDGVILPGVGAFKDAMRNIIKLDLKEPLIEICNSQKPFLGICLGMQLMMDFSEEFGYTEGLGVVKGEVRKFNYDNIHPVPQIQWNTINIVKPSRLLKNINESEHMYFIHSFYVLPNDNSIINAQTDYCGIKYCSVYTTKNIFATQFHPEKSGKNGISILNNFINELKGQ